MRYTAHHHIIIIIILIICFVLFSQTQSSHSPCVGDVTCTNGCCKNNPCLNGGTCNEICEPTSVRYNCSCEVAFAGKHCETRLRSCQDYKAAESDTSGLFTVIDEGSRTFQVFCDFDSEPGFAWNLIESFSLSNKHLFQVTVRRNKWTPYKTYLLSLSVKLRLNWAYSVSQYFTRLRYR